MTQYTLRELYDHNYWREKGFIVGLGRDYPYPERSHLYKGPYNNVGDAMCYWGWNRDNHTSWSIWRGNVGRKGICKHCIRNARRELARKKNSLQGITGLIGG